METTRRVLVVGAGAAGSAAAAALSQAAADLEVVVVGAEDRPPYNRTTVNKGLLSGAVTADGISLAGMDLPAVTWRLGQRVDHLDLTARSVRLTTGEHICADAVVLAVGAAPRRLPLEVARPAADRLVMLRSAEDTARLRALLEDRDPVLIVGGGLIGTETAGVLAAAGHPVQIVDAAGRPMERLVGATVADWILQSHRHAGIDVRVRTTATNILWHDDNGLAITLSDGTVSAPQAIVAALGVRPDTDWLAASGVPTEPTSRAVPVDEYQRVVGRPGIYAAGDIAAVAGPDGRTVRVEHWGAALAQGRNAANSILADFGLGGPGVAPLELPSYSTYVNGTKLTIVGWPELATVETPLAGTPDDDRFAVALTDEQGRLVGAVGVGGARSVNRIRGLIEQRSPASAVPSGAPAGELVF